MKKIVDYPFKYTTFEEAKILIKTGEYRKLCSKEENELTELEILKIEEIEKAVKENPWDISDIIEQHKIIKKYY